MRQHIVSKCYLKAWCDPSTPKGQDPYIWLISRDASRKVKRAPHKSLTKTGAYTITLNDGKSDLRVETTLSQLEAKFVRVQQKIVELKTLDPYDRAYLAAFMATMHSRTDPVAEGMKASISKFHSHVREMEEAIKRGDTAKLPRATMPGEGAPISSADTEYLVRNSRPLVVEVALSAAAPIMRNMPLAFLEAPEGSFFITSDNPCVWFDPEAYKRPPFYRNPGLAMKDIEITMPISPRVMALMTHNAKVQGYTRLTKAHVNELNRRTVGFCHEQFVSNTPETLAIWLDPGTPPPDAWENRVKEEEPRRSPFDEQQPGTES
jgi:hypothetical protein